MLPRSGTQADTEAPPSETGQSQQRQEGDREILLQPLNVSLKRLLKGLLESICYFHHISHAVIQDEVRWSPPRTQEDRRNSEEQPIHLQNWKWCHPRVYYISLWLTNRTNKLLLLSFDLSQFLLIYSKTPSECLKSWVVPNPIYTMFRPIHMYLRSSLIISQAQ